jgi:hypothetical protein
MRKVLMAIAMMATLATSGSAMAKAANTQLAELQVQHERLEAEYARGIKDGTVAEDDDESKPAAQDKAARLVAKMNALERKACVLRAGTVHFGGGCFLHGHRINSITGNEIP